MSSRHSIEAGKSLGERLPDHTTMLAYPFRAEADKKTRPLSDRDTRELSAREFRRQQWSDVQRKLTTRQLDSF